MAAEGPSGQDDWPLEPDAADTWQPSSLPEVDEPDVPVDAPDTIPVGPSAVATAPAAFEPTIQPAMAPATPKAARAQKILPPDAVFDIQQQAEFFTSIGEHDQAIDVLRAHIEEHGDAMPWAYHEFWLRDMEHADSEKSAFSYTPAGCGRSRSPIRLH